jgi:penicillin amidase
VRFGADVTITVRETRHGPVLNDALDTKQLRGIAPGQLVTLSAAWLQPDDRTADAMLAVNRAGNWSDFRDALSGYVAPPQNFVYADVDGNIGYYLPGRIPLRRSGDGSLPAPGWDDTRSWTGYIPFERLPHAYNPGAGVFVNANNRVIGDEYPFFLSRVWGDSYRATRIEALLASRERHSLESFAVIQGDRVSLMAREIVPLLLATVARSPRNTAALDLLQRWNGEMDRTRPEALVFTAWLAEASRRIYVLLLGELAAEHIALNPETVAYVLRHPGEWCGATPTGGTPACQRLVSESLDAALAWIERRQGANPAQWQWGAEHFAEMRHRLFSFLPLLSGVGTLRIPADGDGKTVNKAGMFIRDMQAPFAAREGAGVRALYDLADLNRSQFILATGPSGHPYSPLYRNMLEDWRDIRYVRFASNRAAAERESFGIIELQPRR